MNIDLSFEDGDEEKHKKEKIICLIAHRHCCPKRRIVDYDNDHVFDEEESKGIDRSH